MLAFGRFLSRINVTCVVKKSVGQPHLRANRTCQVEASAWRRNLKLERGLVGSDDQKGPNWETFGEFWIPVPESSRPPPEMVGLLWPMSSWVPVARHTQVTSEVPSLSKTRIELLWSAKPLKRHNSEPVLASAAALGLLEEDSVFQLKSVRVVSDFISGPRQKPWVIFSFFRWIAYNTHCVFYLFVQGENHPWSSCYEKGQGRHAKM